MDVVSAVKADDTAALKKAIDQGASVVDIDKYDRAPLHHASSGECIEILVSAGGDIHAKDKFGRTPLLCAASRDNRDTLQALLSHGASINDQDEHHSTCLHLVNELETVEMLVGFGGRDSMTLPNKDGDLPIHLHCKYGRLPILCYLLEQDSNLVSIPNTRNGKQPIHFAAEYGHVELLHVLVEKGASVNAKDKIGFSPVQYAGLGNWPKLHSHTRSVEFLIEKGADVNQRDRNGWIALHNCTDAPAAEAMIDAGANVRTADRDGRTPLHFAGHELCTSLIEHGADVDAVDRFVLVVLCVVFVHYFFCFLCSFSRCCLTLCFFPLPFLPLLRISGMAVQLFIKPQALIRF